MAKSSRVLTAVVLVAALGLTYLASTAFVTGASSNRPSLRARVVVRAEEAAKAKEPEAAKAKEPEKSGSSALVVISEESKVTAASVLPGIAGLLLFKSLFVAVPLFAAASYVVRQDNDLAKSLKGIAATGLEALNFGGSLNEKYEVTGKIGSSFNENVKKLNGEKGSVSEVVEKVQTAASNLDKEVGIKDSVGNILTEGSNLAAQAVEKVVDLNKEYKVTDQIKEKVDEVTKKK